MRSIISVCLIVVLAMPAVLEAGFTWSQAPRAPWSGRGDHTVTLFHDSLWLIGGYDGGLSSQIWCSNNARNWFLVTDSAPWGGIVGQTVICHNNALWLIGGLIDTSVGGDTGISSTIWRSTNGRHWVKVTDSAPFGKLWLHAAASHQGFLWVLGGSRWKGGGHTINEVWRSPDGEHWTLVCHAPWGRRRDHTITPFHDSLWLFGGDVADPDSIFDWCSGDGATWLGALPRPFWAYDDHACIEFRQKLWVIGGWAAGPTRAVWCSENGRNWTFCDSAPWPARSGHAGAVLRDTLWIFGGYGEGDTLLLNDIWYLVETSGGADEEKLTSKSISQIAPTIIRSSQLSQFFQQLIKQPSVLLNASGQKIAVKPGANNIRHLKSGIYFLNADLRGQGRRQTQNNRKIVLIK